MSKPIPKGTPVDGDMTPDSRFLNALVLQGSLAKKEASHLTVTMDRVEFHPVLKYENGQTDRDAHLLFFKGSDKPLKLCKTNIRRIILQHGSLGSGWQGKKIALGLQSEYRPDLKAKGPCVRVLNIDPETGRIPEAF